MTQSFQQTGNTLRLLAPYDRLTSGLGAKVGAFFGVSCDTVLSGVEGSFETTGVHDLAKLTTDVWAVGDRLYWDDSNKRLTLDSAGGMFVGVAYEITANPSSTGLCKLSGPGDLLEGAQAAVADLSGTLTGTANGSMVDVAATAAATVGGATPTAGQVDTGIALALSTVVSGTNEQLKELQTKLNALLAVLRLAGIIDA